MLYKNLTFSQRQSNRLDSIAELELGEYFFDYLEYDKEIVAKILDIESAMTVVKDIRDYETPEENISLTEVLFSILWAIFDILADILNITIIISKVTLISSIPPSNRRINNTGFPSSVFPKVDIKLKITSFFEKLNFFHQKN